MTAGELESNKFVKAAILETVKNQLRDNDPPETRQTYEQVGRAVVTR